MRRVKKTFTYSLVKVIDTKTKEVLLEDKREGKQTVEKVAADFIKENGYKPNLDFSIEEVSETFVMSADDFMKQGEKIEDEKTDAEDADEEKEGK